MLDARTRVAELLKHGDGSHDDKDHGNRDSTVTRGSWHLTDNPRFELDPEFVPDQNYLAIYTREDSGIYLTDNPEYWVNAHDYVRPFVVEFEVTGEQGSAGVPGSNQEFIPSAEFDRLTIKRVIPVDEWVREEYGEFGWIEDHIDDLSRDPDALPGQLLRLKPPKGYKYTGPDVREMPKAEAQELVERARRYLKENRGVDLEDIGKSAGRKAKVRTLLIAKHPGPDGSEVHSTGSTQLIHRTKRAFHGTWHWEDIIKSGFNPAKIGSGLGTLWGKGAYLAADYSAAESWASMARWGRDGQVLVTELPDDFKVLVVRSDRGPGGWNKRWRGMEVYQPKWDAFMDAQESDDARDIIKLVGAAEHSKADALRKAVLDKGYDAIEIIPWEDKFSNPMTGGHQLVVYDTAKLAKLEFNLALDPEFDQDDRELNRILDALKVSKSTPTRRWYLPIPPEVAKKLRTRAALAKHYGPGPHPGTLSPQLVHSGNLDPTQSPTLDHAFTWQSIRNKLRRGEWTKDEFFSNLNNLYTKADSPVLRDVADTIAHAYWSWHIEEEFNTATTRKYLSGHYLQDPKPWVVENALDQALETLEAVAPEDGYFNGPYEEKMFNLFEEHGLVEGHWWIGLTQDERDEIMGKREKGWTHPEAGTKYQAEWKEKFAIKYKSFQTEGLKRIASNSSVYIRLEDETLHAVLNSGRFVSAFDPSAIGSIDGFDTQGGYREGWEADTFGLRASELSPDHRPIYGYLWDSDDPDTGIIGNSQYSMGDHRTPLMWYGNTAVKLKDSIRPRTSFTVNDSYGDADSVVPTMLESPEWTGGGAYFLDGFDKPSQYLKDSPQIAKYFEAQIHGGVKVSDIEEVVFQTVFDANKYADRLDAAGIEWRVVPPEYT